MDTLYTFGENITHYKTDSVYFWGLMNSATKITTYTILGDSIVNGPPNPILIIKAPTLGFRVPGFSS